jgi:hypothetical protein
VRRLVVTANVIPSSPILVTLTKEALSFSETSVLIRATPPNIPEDGILHCPCYSPLVPEVLVVLSFEIAFIYCDKRLNSSKGWKALDASTAPKRVAPCLVPYTHMERECVPVGASHPKPKFGALMGCVVT